VTVRIIAFASEVQQEEVAAGAAVADIGSNQENCYEYESFK
jgi:hypothetical protein